MKLGIGETIKQLRKERDITQDELADSAFDDLRNTDEFKEIMNTLSETAIP